jgi:hypothetical protein
MKHRKGQGLAHERTSLPRSYPSWGLPVWGFLAFWQRQLKNLINLEMNKYIGGLYG